MEMIPTWIFYLMAAVAGLELGGLATIFIQRWIDEKPILKPWGSACPACSKPLAWRDTVPVLSYLLLRGRCRHCDERIGPQYMLVELSCMAWSLAVAHQFGLSPEWGVYLVLGIILIVGSFIDFETMLLPNRVTLGGAALAVAALFVLDLPGWKNGLLGAAVGGTFFWVLQQAYRLVRRDEGLGTGDVKLMLMIGAMVGFKGLPLTILIASLTSVVGFAFFVFRPGMQEGKMRIPFGPFLSLGCLLYVLYGEELRKWLGM
ncbi:A24 family peptidase [Pseudodesulfovibrio sp. zrk46]|uniref:prepilin peptidase n=1 Tax=Pseudodesulfovibrio sp. zrk46 TaxID=2725288 RepID=UPI001448FB70|nr:A24 family peptidase [Pseudodesulfovibrio sp. zrk46]QJB56920.1 prepilin peptidase [Pseudodesulfovibrio sp. zrk46]